MPLDLSILSYNLPVLYSVAKQPSKEKPEPVELVANLAGTHIYNAAYGWGRVWRILYAIVGLFCKDLKSQKLQAALIKTHDVFQEQLKGITEYVGKYQKYLEERIAGYDDDHVKIPEDEYYEIGHAISAWNDVTLPFLQLIHRKQHAAINEVFRKLMDDTTCDIAKFFKVDLLKKCIHFQRIINVEFELDTKMPFEALARLSEGKKMVSEWKKEVRAFVKKANDNADKVGIRLFHRALRYFMGYVTDKKNYEKNLTRMEMKLADEEYGTCKVFVQPDKDHLEWRDTLRPGTILTFKSQYTGQQTIVLGEQIGKKEDGTDSNIIFAIKGEDEKVVSIAFNEVMHSFKHWQRSAYQAKYGNNPNGVLWPIEFYDIDTSGRIAIVERLHTPIDGIEWTTKPGKSISWDDAPKCDDVWKMLSDFVTMRYTPFPFSPKYLMLDKHDRVKSTKVLYTDSKNPFDFNALEDFVVAFSGGNAGVFYYIMDKSGLLKHENAKFYKRIVKETMEGNVPNAAELGATMGSGISDHKVIDRGQALAHAALALKAECCAILEKELGTKAGRVLDALVTRIFLSAYKESGCAGVLLSTLKDEVLEQARKDLNKSSGS